MTPDADVPPAMRVMLTIDPKRLSRRELLEMWRRGFDVIEEMVRRGLVRVH